MDAQFWHERWREGRTGFNQQKVMPLLQEYWPTLLLATDCTVLVPLCGKSIDMMWLAGQGHKVLGVELSEIAVEQFFTENTLQPQISESELGRHYRAGNIEIICGDIFNLDAATLAGCAAVYDRAALIALPAQMRQRYVSHVYTGLHRNYGGLLITLDYPQREFDGPPFSVDDDEVQRLFCEHTTATILERRDILSEETKFLQAGVSRLSTVVYGLTRKQPT